MANEKDTWELVVDKAKGAYPCSGEFSTRLGNPASFIPKFEWGSSLL